LGGYGLILNHLNYSEHSKTRWQLNQSLAQNDIRKNYLGEVSLQLSYREQL